MDKISPKHFMFLIWATGIVTLKTYPIVFIRAGQRESWVAVILSSIVTFFYFLFVVNTITRFGGNMAKLYQQTMGKVLGNILMAMFALTLFLTLIESASVEADSMHQNMMLETPPWYFLLFFIIPGIYIVRKDTIAVVIVCIVGITLIMTAGINLGMLTTKQKTWSMLFPIFENGVTGGFWIAALKSLGMYGPISITFPYLHLIQEKKKNSMKFFTIIGLIVLIQMQIVSITGIFMTFNLDQALSYYYPKLIQTHLVSYFQIMEFGELYVMLQTLGGWMLKYLVAFHAIIQICKFYHFKKHTIYLATIILSALALAGSFYISYTSIRLFKWLEYFPWICLVNFVVIPCVVCGVYRVKQKLKGTLSQHPQQTQDVPAQSSN